MKRVLLTEAMHPAGMAAMDGRYDVVVAPDKAHETLERLIDDADALVIKLTRTRPELLDARPRLKLVVKHGTGLDDVDVPRATRNGILVANAGAANAVSVAEHALSAMMAVAKRTLAMDAATRSQDWTLKTDNASMELTGRVLGLVGIGNIGMTLAQKAQAGFSMQVIAYDPYADPAAAAEAGIELLDDLDDLCRRSEIVSLHVPLTDATRALFDAARLARLPRGAILVNFARGGVVDEAAVAEALRSGHLFGAAFDVFSKEPVAPDNPLLDAPNIVLSPHAAAYTDGARRRLSLAVVEGLDSFFSGQRPRNAVNLV